MYGGRRGVHRILVGKPEGKKPCGRPRCRWEDNIKKDLPEVGWGDTDWTASAQVTDRWWMLVNAVMNFWVPKMRRISRLAEELLALQEGYCSEKSVCQLVG